MRFNSDIEPLVCRILECQIIQHSSSSVPSPSFFDVIIKGVLPEEVGEGGLLPMMDHEETLLKGYFFQAGGMVKKRLEIS